MIDWIIEFLYKSLFFITPLIFVPITSELFEFNKMLFIYLVTILIVFFWLLKMILTKKIIFKKTPLDIPIFIFLTSQVLSTIFSIDRQTSFLGYYGRFNGGLLSIISYIFLFYGFVSNSIKIESLIKTSLISSFFVILYAIPGKLGHDLTCIFVSRGAILDNSCWSKETNIFDPAIRAFSTLGQPNWFGAYLAVNFFIGIYYLLQKIFADKNYSLINVFKNNLLILVYLFLNFSFIIFSGSRSALLAVFVNIILFIIYYLLFIRKNIKQLFISLFLVLFLPLLFFKIDIKKLILKNQSSTIKSQQSTSDNKQSISNQQQLNITDSSEIRKIIWQGAIKLGLKYPFFGTGVETFAYSYYFTRPKDHNLTSEWDFVYNKAHNEFLNYLATTGFFGLGSYLIMIGVVIFIGIRQISKIHNKYQKENNKTTINQLNNETILVVCFLLAYFSILITNFFGFSTTTINLFFYLLPAFLLMIANNKEAKKDEIIDYYSFKITLTEKISIIFLIFAICYLIFNIFKYWYADTLYAKGLNFLKLEEYQQAAYYFQKALKYHHELVYQDKFSTSLSYLAFISSYQKQKDLSRKYLEISDYYNKLTLIASAKNIFYLKTRAKNMYLFYQATLDKNYLFEGIRALKEAEKIAPTEPKIPYNLAIYYSLLYYQANSPEEKKLFKKYFLFEIDKSIKLKNNFQEAINFKNDFLNKYN